MDLSAAASEAAVRLGHHDVLVVLGSGWSSVAARLGAPRGEEIPMPSLPGFPVPTAPGHGGTFRTVPIGDHTVLIATGRVHLYEGHSPATVAHTVRTAAAAGCRVAILTNAAGLLHQGPVGQVVVITDQINVTGKSPLTGGATGGPSFVDLGDLYSRRLRAIVASVEPTLATGVYVGTHGPEFETPAEIRAYALLGADLVGMSTVIEAIAAAQAGMEVLGLSLVTNLAAGITPAPLDASDFLDVGAAAAPHLAELLAGVIGRLGAA